MLIKFFEFSEEFHNVDDLSAVEIVTPGGFKHTFLFREVCGLRLQSHITDIDTNFDYRRLSVVRKFKKFDILQMITNPSKVVKGFFCTNQIYERQANIASNNFPTNKKNSAFKLKKDDKNLEKLAFAELQTRYEFLGSTFFAKDNFGSTLHEQIGVSCSSKEGESGQAYVLSFDTSSTSKMISFFWSTEPGLGQHVLADHIEENKESSFIYFVSILNIAAIKVLLRNGFGLKYEIWNYTF